MKTKRGMTLFEIIIAIAILGIISVSFISAISNNLSMMFKTKDITEKLFDTQETVENKMEKLREKMWRAGKQYKKDEITIFGTTEYKVKSDFISGSNFDSTKFTSNNILPTTEYLTIGNMFGVSGLNITGLLVNGKSGIEIYCSFTDMQKNNDEVFHYLIIKNEKEFWTLITCYSKNDTKAKNCVYQIYKNVKIKDKK